MKIKELGRTLKQPSGLTVLEFLIVLTTIAFIVLISVPGSSFLLANHRVKDTTGELISSLNSAKYEAMRRHSTVKVCPSSNGKFCRTDGDWSQGWLLFSDGNGDGIVQEIELLSAISEPHEKIRIITSGAVQTTASFTVSGLVEDHDSRRGDFQVCHLGSDATTKIVRVDEDGWIEMTTQDFKGCKPV